MDQKQYVALQRLAKRERKSMGEIVRGLVDRALVLNATEATPVRPLATLCGIITDTSVAGRDHDEALYGLF